MNLLKQQMVTKIIKTYDAFKTWRNDISKYVAKNLHLPINY